MNEEGLNRIVEWRIDNFSCWNGKIHWKKIRSPTTCQYQNLAVELFPRGRSGNDEHMVVRICYDWADRAFCDILLGKLSYISSDGSLLCTQQVDSREEFDGLGNSPGPKFEEVVTQIRKNEALHKDRLTIRLRLKDGAKSVQHIRTKIDAFRNTLKISSCILDHFKEHDSLDIRIEYEEDSNLTLTVSKLECSKIELGLQAYIWEQKIFVITRMTVLNNEEIVRTEENEHLFRKKKKWVFSNSLTTEEMAIEGFSLILYIKAISKNKLKHSGGFFHERSFHPSVVTLMPSNGFRSSTSVPQECLSKELMCLYQDQDFSDFQLKCENISFPVHKNILSARSPVFKTMLSTDMREAASGCMDIVDLEPSTLSIFLTYLYTGAVEELQWEIALKLYYAAEKYQVPSLKKVCADFLSANVSLSNVCDILSLADKQGDGQLIAVCHEFLLKNFNEVLRSEKWKSFIKSEPLLAAETVTHFADKNFVKTS